MHKMKSGGWPYPIGRRSSSNASSLCAVVVCAVVAAVFRLRMHIHLVLIKVASIF